MKIPDSQLPVPPQRTSLQVPGSKPNLSLYSKNVCMFLSIRGGLVPFLPALFFSYVHIFDELRVERY